MAHTSPHFVAICMKLQSESAAPAADPFFETIHDGEWNACVGIQGSPENYVDGYIEAALELASAVIDKRLVASRDTLAMPILYNCRHGLELALKYAIDRLHATAAIAIGHPANHDILSHWQHLQNAKVGDDTLKTIIAGLEPYVRSLAAIDVDGQELRYAVNRDGKQSMSGIAVVNLPHIRRSIKSLSHLLQRLKSRVHEIEDERTTGTHTAECSRADLQEIARSLGDHSAWLEPGFADRKAVMMDKFGLGSHKFSFAVNAIRASRALAAIVGIESDLKHLSDDQAIATLSLWATANPVQARNDDDLGLDYFNRGWEAVKEHGRISRELDEAVMASLSVQEFADLQVLYYLGRNKEPGEHYEALLDSAISSFHGKLSWQNVHHLMTKTNLLDSVIAGATAAGRPTLSVKLRRIRAAPGNGTT